MPGAERSGFRMFALATFGPREERSLTIGACTVVSGMVWISPNAAVPSGVDAMKAFSASPCACARCTVDSVCAWLMMVLAPPATLAMTTPAAPAVLAFALLLTSTLPPRSHTSILPATFAGSR
ncbi:hypothetical protein D3C81_1066340 [compost metagenome]